MFNIGISIAVIGVGVRGLPNLSLAGTCAIIAGGILMLVSCFVPD